jgi:hypothetical protein
MQEKMIRINIKLFQGKNLISTIAEKLIDEFPFAQYSDIGINTTFFVTILMKRYKTGNSNSQRIL